MQWCVERAETVQPEEDAGGLTNVYKYLKEGCKEESARFFSVVPSDRTSSYGCKREQNKFSVNIRKTFFIVKVVTHWNWLPREAVESPSLEIL